MPEYNLLDVYPKIVRNIQERQKGQAKYAAIAKQYGVEYFDGIRAQGYGGYHYDGRWVPVAERIIQRYDLRPGDRVLDVGCAKGFLLKDLQDLCPGLEVWGIDISEYALNHSHPDVKGRLIRASAEKLPFANGFFKAVTCMNVIHNLEYEACVRAIKEIERLSAGKSYIQVDAYRNEIERELFLNWVLTAITFGTPEFWRKILQEACYSGDYYWTILENS